MFRLPVKPIVIAVVTLSLVACNSDEKKSPSQVLAKVNSKEITYHDLDLLLQGKKNPTPQMKQNALDTLVNEEVLVQSAEEQKLDRDTEVLQRIDAARREVLATAALQRLVSRPSVPTDTTVQDYYNSHPNMFAERKFFIVTEFLVDKAAYTSEVANALNSSKSDADTVNYLKAHNIKYIGRDSKWSSGQMDAKGLDKLSAMTAGDIFAQTVGDKEWLVQMKSKEDAPLTKEQAASDIARMLQNDEFQSERKLKVASLRAAAKIEYKQRFVADKGASEAAASESDGIEKGLK